MTTIRTTFIATPLLVGLLYLTGCGEEKHSSDDGHGHEAQPAQSTDAHDHEAHGHGDGHGEGDGHDHGVEAAGASFEEGQGIRFEPSTAEVLGLKTAPVTERHVRHGVQSSGQVFRGAGEPASHSGNYRKGTAYVSALINSDVAKRLKIGQDVQLVERAPQTRTFTGKLSRFERALESVTGQVELIIAVPDPDKVLKVGDFLGIEAVGEAGDKKETVVSVPDAAVIRAASGTFVYVANGDYFLKTDVETGQQGEGYTEIVDGLYEGDEVVVSPTEKLWLIELRAVKGGGHSH